MSPGGTPYSNRARIIYKSCNNKWKSDILLTRKLLMGKKVRTISPVLTRTFEPTSSYE